MSLAAGNYASIVEGLIEALEPPIPELPKRPELFTNRTNGPARIRLSLFKIREP